MSVKELSEVVVENAVSAFRTALESITPAEIDHSDLADHVDIQRLSEKISYESLAEWMDSSSVAYEMCESKIAEHIDLECLAVYVDSDAVVEQLREGLPQVDDLEILQGRQKEMWECYIALKTYFSSNAAAPVDADGELK